MFLICRGLLAVCSCSFLVELQSKTLFGHTRAGNSRISHHLLLSNGRSRFAMVNSLNSLKIVCRHKHAHAHEIYSAWCLACRDTADFCSFVLHGLATRAGTCLRHLVYEPESSEVDPDVAVCPKGIALPKLRRPPRRLQGDMSTLGTLFGIVLTIQRGL